MEENNIFEGEILDERVTLSLRELCKACGIDADIVVDMVEYGLIEPKGDEPPHWQFDLVALRRTRSALRIHRDFNIDLIALSLVLDLVDEIQTLRNRIKILEQQLI